VQLTAFAPEVESSPSRYQIMSDIITPQPPRVIIAVNDKSCGKTLLQQLLGDVCMRSGYTVEYFQSDSQPYLGPYGQTRTIPLATTSEMLEDSTTDVERHDVALQAVKSLPDKPLHVIAYDSGANTVERIANVMEIIRLNERVLGTGIRGLTVIPVTAREDIIESGSAAFARMKSAFPDFEVMIAVSQRDGDPRRLDKKHAFWRLLAQADRTLDLPRVSQDMLIRMRESRRPLHELADPEGPVSTETLARELGLSEAVTELMRAMAATLVSAFDEVAADMGFPLDA
jgi:hypothetical protein